MERLIRELFQEGLSDEEIAHHMTNLGHRSPQSPHVLTSTVKKVRHRLGLLRSCSQSHPRNMSGSLTVSQVAQKLGVSVGWVYDRIHNGRIRVAKDAATGLYLFPDEPATMERLRELKEGKIHEIGF
jgi:excisionase family DNA binding protein